MKPTGHQPIEGETRGALRDDPMLDGSLESEQEAPEAYPLLAELGGPTDADVQHLQRSVVDALTRDPPEARARRRTLVLGLVAAAALAAVVAGAVALL